MKKITIGILAHVDAGKTTLSEALLFTAGAIKNLGRVDKQDTYLDTDEIERSRGITVFSKQARFSHDDTQFVLLDTPGHTDFSVEAERTLQVIDYAILVISGTEGLQAHTKTLWRLLKLYDIPVFIFVNKMDMPLADKAQIMKELCMGLSEQCIDFSCKDFKENDLEQIAMSEEKLLDKYLNGYTIDRSDISGLIKSRLIFPCFFGSSLKLEGIAEFLDGLSVYCLEPSYGDDFKAAIYKISYDEQNVRLTHMKITGGILNTRDVINGEKVTQIRLYSGEKYNAMQTVSAGDICTVTGLSGSYAGEIISDGETVEKLTVLEPVLKYRLIFPPDTDSKKVYQDIVSLNDELPELNISWDEKNGDINVKIMGQVQLEILSRLLERKYDLDVKYGMGDIEYRETITNSVIGVGHFEPLRHYAEVHLMLSPGEPGSGISISSDCSTDKLDKNWQRLIMSCLKTRSLKGVLTGSPLTDVKITVINGRAHDKHTVGGDFRQAAGRAVRQGLMKADSKLLEPYYDFELKIPASLLGKAMTELDMLYAVISSHTLESDTAVICGYGPVATLRDYQENVNAYTKGLGSISCTFKGYMTCHNEEDIVETSAYDPDKDAVNLSSSVFCAHGSGYIVPWYEVEQYMHVFDDIKEEEEFNPDRYAAAKNKSFDYSIGTDEIDEIINRTAYSNKRAEKHEHVKKIAEPEHKVRYKQTEPLKRLLIVDGYNVIFADEELKSLAETNIVASKDKLIQLLANYSATTDIPVMLVFDGYKLKNNRGQTQEIDNITVIHTKEGETADAFIEKFTNSGRKCYNITVASSDGLIQQITRGQDCNIMSSRELIIDINEKAKELREQYNL
ncbi:MAG: GTP-binding protein [Lachnospiraceae bacterium]|nr:GTP-binding protein [Lachnospiraceae bacterium]